VIIDMGNSTSTTELATAVGERLALAGHVLATAESCTGGGIAQAVTAIAGSSAWFDCGFVTYSNEAKTAMLGVKESTLIEHGAVSEAVVREMAEGALHSSQATLAVSVSGIAGPGGGSKEKPVGTVWLAWSSKNKSTAAACFSFNGDRESVRNQAVNEALNGVIKYSV